MELKNFVTSILTEIIEGVRDAQILDRPAHEGEVNPLLSSSPAEILKQGYLLTRYGEPMHIVKFDVAVTTQEGSGTKGGLGIFVGPIGIGAQGDSTFSNSSVSRIQFEVPVSLPCKNKIGA